MIKLNNNLYLVNAKNDTTYPFCYCLYIKDDLAALLDTCCEYQTAVELASQGIDIIINSHFHIDHTLYNNLFTNAQVYIHTLDAPPLKSKRVYLSYYGFDVYNQLELGEEYYNFCKMQSSPVHKELQGDELLDFGATKFRVIHTPGHTPGHCAFWEENIGLLFAGDISLSKFGPWYFHVCSNINDFIDSIKKCMDLKPEVLICGHSGLIKEKIQQRLQDYINKIYETDDRFLEFLTEPKNFEQLVARYFFFGPNLKELVRFRRFFERMGTAKHLERLIELNLVRKEDDLYFRC